MQSCSTSPDQQRVKWSRSWKGSHADSYTAYQLGSSWPLGPLLEIQKSENEKWENSSICTNLNDRIRARRTPCFILFYSILFNWIYVNYFSHIFKLDTFIQKTPQSREILGFPDIELKHPFIFPMWDLRWNTSKGISGYKHHEGIHYAWIIHPPCKQSRHTLINTCINKSCTISQYIPQSLTPLIWLESHSQISHSIDSVSTSATKPLLWWDRVSFGPLTSA